MSEITVYYGFLFCCKLWFFLCTGSIMIVSLIIIKKTVLLNYLLPSIFNGNFDKTYGGVFPERLKR